MCLLECDFVFRQKNLTEIKENDLNKLVKLEDVRLSRNNISYIDPNAFKNLTHLKR